MKEESTARKKAERKQEDKKIDIVSLRMIREATVKGIYDTISSPADVGAMVQKLIGSNDRENFGVVCLDTKNRPTHISIVSVGTLNSSVVHPREVFKAAILSNSASIILFHNHPSGNTNPSNTDLEVTERLVEAGRIIGIQVLDHVIVSEERYISMKEKMLI